MSHTAAKVGALGIADCMRSKAGYVGCNMRSSKTLPRVPVPSSDLLAALLADCSVDYSLECPAEISGFAFAVVVLEARAVLVVQP